MPKPILFLSDLGVRDEFVGVCHSVIASIAPGAPVIDLSHGVPPQDVQAGALTFRDCIAFAPQDSILLGVVDPGVGTDRKAVAVETASQRVLVGPDNGLLSLAWDAAGGPTRAFEITAPDVGCSRSRTCSTGATCSLRRRPTWRPASLRRSSVPRSISASSLPCGCRRSTS